MLWYLYNYIVSEAYTSLHIIVEYTVCTIHQRSGAYTIFNQHLSHLWFLFISYRHLSMTFRRLSVSYCRLSMFYIHFRCKLSLLISDLLSFMYDMLNHFK
jgi:hypothetical protein